MSTPTSPSDVSSKETIKSSDVSVKETIPDSAVLQLLKEAAIKLLEKPDDRPNPLAIHQTFSLEETLQGSSKTDIPPSVLLMGKKDHPAIARIKKDEDILDSDIRLLKRELLKLVKTKSPFMCSVERDLQELCQKTPAMIPTVACIEFMASTKESSTK